MNIYKKTIFDYLFSAEMALIILNVTNFADLAAYLLVLSVLDKSK